MITMNGTPIHTIGTLPAVSTEAPHFTVTKSDLTDVNLDAFAGKKIVLNIFPSLDTAVCGMAMVKFNEMAKEFPQVTFLCISADLPFAQQRFCAAKELKNVITGSVFRHPQFGTEFGVTITDGPIAGLLSRAVVIIDEGGRVVYTEQVKDIIDEPDYESAIKALTS